MKKNRMQISTLLTLLLCMLLLTACGASTTESEGTDPETPPQESAAAPETEEPSAQQEDVTLEELLGEDYVELPDGDDHDADGQPHGQGPGGPLLPD